MFRKRVLYYIFWISVPMIVGAFLSWGVLEGGKAVFYYGFKKEKNIVFSWEQSTKPEAQTEGQKGNNEENNLKEANPDYSFIDSETTASVGENGLLKKIESSLPKKPFVKVTAAAYLAADLDSGEILIEKNKDSLLPIASVTKLVTALVAIHTLPQEKTLSVSKSSVETYGTAGELKIGEKLKVKDLLYPLLLESSNDAAEVLAESDGRAAFLEKMNKTALSIGAKDTFFDDPSGLSFKNVSTAEDLFKIAQYIYKKERDIFSITHLASYKVGKHTFKNPTILLRVPSYIGGKNGFTDEAERTAVSLFSIPQKNGPNRNIAVVILKSKDRNADVGAVINYVSQHAQYPSISASEDDEEFF